MKTIFLTLILLVFGFSSFAFMPAFSSENSNADKNVAITSEKPKSENKTEAETKTVTAKELTQEVQANYEANKKNMTFKERIANKLLIKTLKKAEKKQLKNPDAVSDTKDASLAKIFRIIGIVFIIVGLVGLLLNNYALGYTLTLILIGILFLILPSLL